MRYQLCRFSTIIILLGSLSFVQAQVPLETVLGNLGFEDDVTHSHWTATLPNTQNYALDAPMVAPMIVPFGAVDALLAPSGTNFIGVLNPDDANVSGKLVHDAVGGDFPAGTTFTMTVWGNRGRLDGASSAAFPSQPSRMLVTVVGWGPGVAPSVNPATDDWSRQPLVRKVQEFTAWGANGAWASQTMTVTTTSPLAFISLAVSCQNKIHSSFCAFDLE